MQMLQPDWLSCETLSVIHGMHWLELLYKMGNFSFLYFSKVLVGNLETLAKFLSGLSPLLNFTDSNNKTDAHMYATASFR